jgi:predicted Zn finger-like uncharacterized protein
MKITCQSCQAKYTIADEKVAGKTVKIKCKKCGAAIVVNGTEPAMATGPIAGPGAGPAAAPPGDDDDGEGATRVFAEGQGPGGGDEWTVNVSDEDQRTLTTPQIVIEYQRGVITADTYVWKDGMADWLPLSGVPELMRMVGGSAPMPAAGAPAAAPAPAPAPAYAGAATAAPSAVPAMAMPPGGLGGTMMMTEAPSPVAALSPSAQAQAALNPPTAARRVPKPNPGIDLFATGTNPEPQMAGPAASTATTSADRLVGERNENSVLFSISALTAAAAAAKKGGSGEVNLLDFGPSPAPKNGGRGGVDDLINLGGGMPAGPMLAPPPLLAPVVEAPPPPPQPVAPAMSPGMSPAYNPAFQAGMIPDYQPKKSSKGLVIGIVAGVVVLGGATALFLGMRGGGPDKTAGADQAQTATTAAAPPADTGTPTPAATPAQTQAAATPPPADTAPAGNTDTKPDKPADTKPVPAGPGKPVPGPGPGPGKPADTKPDKPADTKPDKPADTKPADTKPDKPADTKPDKPADTGGGSGKDFDRGAAAAALSGAAGAARGCKTGDGPTGAAHVRITFAPSGSVTSVTVDAPFSGTSVGSCITSAFKGAHVPAFDGSPVVVPKTISIN